MSAQHGSLEPPCQVFNDFDHFPHQSYEASCIGVCSIQYVISKFLIGLDLDVEVSNISMPVEDDSGVVIQALEDREQLLLLLSEIGVVLHQFSKYGVIGLVRLIWISSLPICERDSKHGS